MDMENLNESPFTGTTAFSQHDVHQDKATRFGSPADDYMERGIDLNEQLIKNKPATFFMRVNSDAMIDAGIFQGDVVIIDRSIKAANGKIVIAALHGEMVIRRFEKNFNRIRLIPETKNLSPIDVDSSCDEFAIWGVVTYVIHSLS